MEDRVVFVDESGSPGSPDDPGSSFLFVITAVIVAPRDVLKLEDFVNAELRALNLRKHGRKKEELKFSRLKTEQRRAIFARLDKLDFAFRSVVVDKGSLRSPGLLYSDVFYKFFFGKLTEAIAQSYGAVELHLDNYGNERFQTGLRNYIRREYAKPGLFDNAVFLSHDSRVSKATQVADLVAGAVGRAAGAQKTRRRDWTYLRLIAGHDRGIIYWPRPYGEVQLPSPEANEWDQMISDESERRARYFLARSTTNASVKATAQRAVSEYLLYTDEYVPGFGLCDFLSSLGLQPVTGDRDEERGWLQRHVIAPLRDRGLLITSRSGNYEPGYKLIRRASEAREFVRVYWKRIAAMARRAEDVRDAILGATANSVDVRTLPPDIILDLNRCDLFDAQVAKSQETHHGTESHQQAGSIKSQ